MNEVIKFIESRRSCHRFRTDPVPDEYVRAVAEAGLYAPSAMNRRPCRVIVINSPETRDRIARLNAGIMGRDEKFDPFYGAPIILLVVADVSVPTRVYDGSLVLSNMLLAAHSLGLGACWIHRAKEEIESGELDSLLSTLGLDGGWEGIGHCALGWSAEDVKPVRPIDKSHILYLSKEAI